MPEFEREVVDHKNGFFFQSFRIDIEIVYFMHREIAVDIDSSVFIERVFSFDKRFFLISELKRTVAAKDRSELAVVNFNSILMAFQEYNTLTWQTTFSFSNFAGWFSTYIYFMFDHLDGFIN